MKTRYALFLALSLSACVAVPDQRATMLPTIDGRDRYAISGLVMVPKVTEGVTKPYVEQGLAQTCTNGVEYEEFMEAPNKTTPLGTWMQWKGVVVCK